jgi:membrane protease YdiL (CAAX protease family)
MNTDNKPLIELGWLRALVYLLITSAVIYSLLFLAGSAEAKPGGKEVIEEGENSFSGFIFTYCLLSLIMIGFAYLFRRIVDKQRFFTLGFDWKNNQSYGFTGFFLGVLLLCAGSIILVLLNCLFFTGVEFDGSKLFYSLILFIIVAFTEEIAFRGYILNNLLQSMNKWVALALSSLAFALFHATNPGANILPIINVFAAGMLLGINYIYTKNLWFGILFHFSWNYFEGPVLGYEVSGFSASGFFQQTLSGPELLTGGDFGFEGSIVCLAVISIATVLLAWHYGKNITAEAERTES